MGEPWQRSDATRISDYGGSVILPIGEGDRKRGGGRQSIPSLGLTTRPQHHHWHISSNRWRSAMAAVDLDSRSRLEEGNSEACAFADVQSYVRAPGIHIRGGPRPSALRSPHVRSQLQSSHCCVVVFRRVDGPPFHVPFQ